MGLHFIHFFNYNVLVSFYTYKKRKITRDANRSKELFEIKKEKELYNAKMQFFTFLIHEIRTPLTLIYAPLKKSIKLKNQSDELKQYLDIINRNTQRLIDLCNQLLILEK
jgi:signal transduction histidine kinase